MNTKLERKQIADKVISSNLFNDDQEKDQMDQNQREHYDACVESFSALLGSIQQSRLNKQDDIWEPQNV